MGAGALIRHRQGLTTVPSRPPPPPPPSDGPAPRDAVHAALQAAIRQIDAAVHEQEQAAERILGLAERLLANASDRSTQLRAEAVMEACSFQDLTGQRLRKVRRLLRHLEKHGVEGVSAKAYGLDANTGAGESQAGRGLTQEQVDALLNQGRAR